jgi:peptide-methionine (S)-S-oxide reductase
MAMIHPKYIFTALFAGFGLVSCAQQSGKPAVQEGSVAKKTAKKEQNNNLNKKNMEVATFGAGCFWCVEAVFQQVDGVEKVVSGYAGGHVENPTYEQVCDKTTGHAEVTQITFDTTKVSFAELLEVFWKTHDPTTLNRQGNDVGPQYRSAIFYHNDAQKALAEKYKKELEAAQIWPNPIVTEIGPLTKFYAAEDYHQNYYNLNANKNPYCSFVITPKLDKFRKVFKDKLKAEK